MSFPHFPPGHLLPAQGALPARPTAPLPGDELAMHAVPVHPAGQPERGCSQHSPAHSPDPRLELRLHQRSDVPGRVPGQPVRKDRDLPVSTGLTQA